jgi:hypothetical protein
VAYRCQSETKADRTLRRVAKLRERLGWHPGVASPNAGRPWYMNQSTYNRLARQIDALTDQALGNSHAHLQHLRGAGEGRHPDAPHGAQAARAD